MLSQCLIDTDKVAEAQAAEAAAQSEEAAEEQVSENDVPVVASEYADIAIAQVDNYVNVRAEANTDSEVLGKLYNNSAATVLETTDDGWYKINSGSVTGYVKAEYVVTGDEELARRVDFLGIGTNDLTQYTLAMDRQNPLLQKKYNDHHPAVVRMIKMIIDAGHKENCKVCLCGELAADTRLTETFLRMGVDALSVVPACILPVRKALRAARVKNEDE